MKDPKKRPIDRQRDSAFEFKIGDGEEPASIEEMITFSDRLLAVTEKRTFEVLLPDQIDPARENPNVPHTQVCLLKYGSHSDLLGRTLLLCNVLLQPMHLEDHVDRDRIMELALSLATKFASMQEKTDRFIALVESAVENIPDAAERARENNIFAVPEVQGSEDTCKEIFLAAKQALQDVLDMAQVFFGDDLKPGYFSNIMEFAKEKYGDVDEFTKLLEESKPMREFIRETRNSFEHPKPNKRVIVRNIRINKDAQIELPTFEHVHPDWHQPEVRLDDFFPLIIDRLLEFCETMIAFMVAKNMNGKFAGFDVQLLWHPDGMQRSPKVRFGYGIYHDGKLQPLG
jgi:hypothetical protein